MKRIEPYFSCDGATLLHGDAVECMASIPDGSVDLVFADPPYNLSNGGFTCQGGKRAPVDKGAWDQSAGIEEDFAFHRRWIEACGRVLRDGGTIWISGTYHSIYACGFALQLLGFQILNDICWYKPNAPPNLSTRYFTASHETLIWAKKGEERHTFNYDEMKNGEWEYDVIKRPGKQMRSVWSVPAPKPSEKREGKHPTQKPLALLERVVLASSEEGDLVLDPFAGSSTTGLAAVMHGRRFLGIEREKEYLDLSVRRFRALMD
ncbi:site-specific DNA-methyltransferase [Methanofollis formosanus]|uniref:Type II methyltransferase n=1 Tax=Methanofollis formosanus TaxID=299308 RepID=A0A8G1A0I8_9EURY|nr:site-specific DNA-methyltransferase [Methanofollis formosanus]QYZ78174.1 site-specific DNA-methyltransferase [Methanofollis formosanus]